MLNSGRKISLLIFVSGAWLVGSVSCRSDDQGVDESASTCAMEVDDGRADWNTRIAALEAETAKIGAWFVDDLCTSLKTGSYKPTVPVSPKLTIRMPAAEDAAGGGKEELTVYSAGASHVAGSTWWALVEKHVEEFASISICKSHIIGDERSADGAITLEAYVHLAGYARDGRPLEEHLSIETGFSPKGAEVRSIDFVDGYRVRRPFEPFREITQQVGVQAHLPGIKTFAGKMDVSKSVGLSVVDINEDGLLDIYLIRKGPNLLYIQKDDGTFDEQAAAWGIRHSGDGRSALFIDADGDGDLDLFLANHPRSHALNQPSLFAFRREAGNKFVDVSERAFAKSARGGLFSQVIAADVDGDRDLDILGLRYGNLSVESPNHIVAATNGHKNTLFLNDGDFRFTEAGAERGVVGTSWSFAGGFADYDHDGDQDVYIANDWGADAFLVNDGKGYFRDQAKAMKMDHRGASMGVVWGDFNDDRKLDLFVSGMYSSAGSRITQKIVHLQADSIGALKTQARGNMIFLSDAGSGFTSAASSVGHLNAGWAWAPILFDYDLDGDEDLYVANGYYSGKQKREL